jgi:hypothetical protein
VEGGDETTISSALRFSFHCSISRCGAMIRRYNWEKLLLLLLLLLLYRIASYAPPAAFWVETSTCPRVTHSTNTIANSFAGGCAEGCCGAALLL